jgi:hypothetical protein
LRCLEKRERSGPSGDEVVVPVKCELTQSGPCWQCKCQKLKCTLTPLKADGQPERIRFDTHTAKMLRWWVNATNDVLQGTNAEENANNLEALSRDQLSNSPSSTLGHLGQLSLQGDPSPTEVCHPLSDTANTLIPASRKSLEAGPILPSPSQLSVPCNTADAPSRAPRNRLVPHRDLAAPSQPSVPRNTVSDSGSTPVNPSHHILSSTLRSPAPRLPSLLQVRAKVRANIPVALGELPRPWSPTLRTLTLSHRKQAMKGATPQESRPCRRRLRLWSRWSRPCRRSWSRMKLGRPR